jgi:hypothetical protein
MRQMSRVLKRFAKISRKDLMPLLDLRADFKHSQRQNIDEVVFRNEF